MPQYGQNNPTPHAQPMNGLGLLPVVLLAYNDKGDRAKDGDRYVTVKFPQTYEDTMSSIQQSLGQHLEGGPNSIDFVDILYPVLNIDDEWIWVEVNKDEWDLLIEELPRTRKILAIRQRLNSSKAQKDPVLTFIRGPVTLTYGKTKGGLTSWTEVSGDGVSKPQYNTTATINRPTSYKDAIDLIIQGAKESMGYGWSEHRDIKNIKDVNQVKFKFYYFPTEKAGISSMDAWLEFPDEAYDNDNVWRTFVPRVHKVLGYTLHPVLNLR